MTLPRSHYSRWRAVVWVAPGRAVMDHCVMSLCLGLWSGSPASWAESSWFSLWKLKMHMTVELPYFHLSNRKMLNVLPKPYSSPLQDWELHVIGEGLGIPVLLSFSTVLAILSYDPQVYKPCRDCRSYCKLHATLYVAELVNILQKLGFLVKIQLDAY